MAACAQCGSSTKFYGGLGYSYYKGGDIHAVEISEEEAAEAKKGFYGKEKFVEGIKILIL